MRLLLFLLCCSLLPAQSANQRGWWPQAYSVQRDAAAGKLVLSTPYYTVEHDLKRGGEIALIRYTHGRRPNLLVQPFETKIRLATADKASPDMFSDLNDSAPRVSAEGSGKWPVVIVESCLLNKDGRPSGVKLRTTYTYRWGYIKTRKEFVFPSDPVQVRSLAAVSALFDPSLEDYGHRPGVSEEFGGGPFPWQTGQIRQWGKMRPGTHFDLPFQTRFVPRYVVLANHGVEGIEWFVSSDLAQWDYQLTGKPGDGFAEIRSSTSPLGIAFTVNPLNLSPAFDLPHGGSVPLKGTYTFDYYIGMPILEGHANKPWLNRSYAANRGNWVSEDEISKNAAAGVVTMHLHNDGDSNRDGLFWRDGSYPPYPPEEMKKMDRVIETCHKYGIKTVPYFSNHELHQSTEVFKQHGEEWGRKPDDEGNLRPNYYYGAHMCLKSGWRDWFKFSVDRVLKNHKFDGVYYDWNIALFCNNPLHVGKQSNGVPAANGIGSWAISPTGHWDIDELIDVVEWTRERVGPQGTFIIHNTLAPMFVTENFANYVVGMEFSYGKVTVSMPGPNELPLEWNFAGARPRAVIEYGTLEKDAPARLRKALALTCLMTSVAPWPATDEALELFKILKPLGNIQQYQFEDWRTPAVRTGDEACIPAVYSRPSEAYVLLANFEPEAREIACKIDPGKFKTPLKSLKSAVLLNRDRSLKLNAQRLASAGEKITIPGDSAVMIQLQ